MITMPKGTPVCFLTRKASFSAAHRLHSIALTDSENEMTYGKCNNPNGHGHNYTVEVTLRGPIDADTGMIFNLTTLKNYIEEAVIQPLDHKNIDLDVPYFRVHTSTVENLAVYIWQSLADILPDPTLLYEIKLWETEKNAAVFRGDFVA